MLIAQLSVAGEGQERLCASEPFACLSETSIRTANAATQDGLALEEYSCDRTNLPWVIFRAAHRASHLSVLPSRARALLAALARTVDAHRPFAAIFARRELLTGRALQSMRTFYRSLDDLEAAGLIDRAPQRRHGEAGLFGRAYLHLTHKAAELLGLVQATVGDNHAAANTVDAVEADDAPVLVQPSATLADRAIYKDLFPQKQKRQPGRVPADLERLRALGFREFLIFKLMSEARQHGKRLSDVVEACWRHLASARHPINYLRALLKSTADFAFQIQTRQRADDDTRKEETRRAEADACALTHAGRVFFDASGSRRIEVSEDGARLTVAHAGETALRHSTDGWKVHFAQALASGRLRSASPQLADAFASANNVEAERATLPDALLEAGARAPNPQTRDSALRILAATPPCTSEMSKRAQHATSSPIKRTLSKSAIDALTLARSLLRAKGHVMPNRQPNSILQLIDENKLPVESESATPSPLKTPVASQ
jgi:hypothetical protein